MSPLINESMPSPAAKPYANTYSTTDTLTTDTSATDNVEVPKSALEPLCEPFNQAEKCGFSCFTDGSRPVSRLQQKAGSHGCEFAGDLQCFFSRTRNESGNFALLARINVYLEEAWDDSLPSLLSCAAELNMRLPTFKIRVCADSQGTRFFSLYRLSEGSLDTPGIADFVAELWEDFKAFWISARAQGLHFKLSGDHSYVDLTR